MAIPSLSIEQLRSADNTTLCHHLSEADTAIHALLEHDQISDELVAHLVNWLRIKVAQANAKGLALGISGGVDSATVAVLSERAIPLGNRYFFLPCQSVEQDLEDAQLVAQTIGIRLEIVDILPQYVSVCAALGANPEEDPTPLHLMNLKAMIRMTFLATVANQSNLLLAGTGNRSEIEHAGFFTKRGDGAADNAVLGHLFKEQVRAVARRLGIPKSIVDRPPTPGLRILPNGTTLTDEAEMGLLYTEIEAATRILMEFGADLAFLTSAVKERFPGSAERMLTVCKELGIRSWKNRHKLEPLPIAGSPRCTAPVFNEYPRGFPDLDSLRNWNW